MQINSNKFEARCDKSNHCHIRLSRDSNFVEYSSKKNHYLRKSYVKITIV